MGWEIKYWIVIKHQFHSLVYEDETILGRYVLSSPIPHKGLDNSTTEIILLVTICMVA